MTRGVDFKGVETVINVDAPAGVARCDDLPPRLPKLDLLCDVHKNWVAPRATEEPSLAERRLCAAMCIGWEGRGGPATQGRPSPSSRQRTQSSRPNCGGNYRLKALPRKASGTCGPWLHTERDNEGA